MQKAYHARGLRFLSQAAFIITVGLITAIASYQATATDVFTDPVGFITVTAEGTSGHAGSSALSFWGLGMAQLPVVKGIINSVSGQQLTDLAGNWANNQYNGANGAYEIEITSGPSAGLVDSISNSAAPGTIYTSFNDSSMISSGQTYLIRPSWTLNALFGSADSAGLFGSSGPTLADNINVWNPAVQGSVTYYYKTNSNQGGSGWRTAANNSVNVGTNALFIDQGLTILRRVSNSTNVLLVGAVKLGQTLSPIVGSGLTFAGNPYPASFTLGGSGLYTTNDATGLHGASGPTIADNVNIWNPAVQGSVTYYFKTNSNQGGSGWRTAANNSVDVSSSNINLGTMIIIQRRVATPFNWFMQQPFVE